MWNLMVVKEWGLEEEQVEPCEERVFDVLTR